MTITTLKPGDEFAMARANPDMTLAQLRDLHLKAYEFTQTEGDFHEYSHLILGLAGVYKPQNCWSSEVLALSIERAMRRITTRNRNEWSLGFFTEQVLHENENALAGENLSNALYAIAKRTPLGAAVKRGDLNEIRQSVARRFARTYGFAFECTTNQSGFLERWSLKSDTEEYSYDHTQGPRLPPGAEDFHLFSVAEIESIYDKTDGGVRFMLEKITHLLSGIDCDSFNEAAQDEQLKKLGDIRVGDIIVALAAKRPPAPVLSPDTLDHE